MKYMGSKRFMLNNGLGQLLLHEVQNSTRFVDLFTGAGSVAWFIAQKTEKPVLAVDLQRYSTILAEAVICRSEPIDFKLLEEKWITKVISERQNCDLWHKSKNLRIGKNGIKSYVDRSRKLCQKTSSKGTIWNSYGGHYFSPAQAITFDLLLDTLPEEYQERVVCLAACISAASQCVAAPGHTAQPFQPTEGAGKYIIEAWSKEPIDYIKKSLIELCPLHSNKIGSVITGDAQSVVDQIQESDLVFIDPPYSGVQYSRFYHVLETIAKEIKKQEVTGTGRYPAIADRPQSSFSNVGSSKKALTNLFDALSKRKCIIVFTFPSGLSSNGLSGVFVKEIASNYFSILEYKEVSGTFSTLGGNNNNRVARQKSRELILLLKPK